MMHQAKSTQVLTQADGSIQKGLDTSRRIVDSAKKATKGVWRINHKEILDIARKYAFNIPTPDKPVKHLGSTGIKMIYYKPGVFFLYKPHAPRKQTRKKKTGAGNRGPLIKGIF